MDSSILVISYMIINLILMVLSVAFYISTKKETTNTKLKILIVILIITSLSIYIFSSPIKIIPTIQPQITSQDIILINSIFLLFALSSTLFFYSLYDSDEDIVDLKFPSFFKSRKGTIRIGKSLKKKQNKYKFFLSLKDLEKHMFVCGATGTGKSNFIQYFLINLSKRHKIPFLLVEFKGEYHFLQKQIDNLLIIRAINKNMRNIMTLPNWKTL